MRKKFLPKSWDHYPLSLFSTCAFEQSQKQRFEDSGCFLQLLVHFLEHSEQQVRFQKSRRRPIASCGKFAVVWTPSISSLLILLIARRMTSTKLKTSDRLALCLAYERTCSTMSPRSFSGCSSVLRRIPLCRLLPQAAAEAGKARWRSKSGLWSVVWLRGQKSSSFGRSRGFFREGLVFGGFPEPSFCRSLDG